MQTKPTSAYVHIPFCTQICYYCDFSKVFIKNQPVDDYLRALIREWELSDIKELRTLYIGGGTPTAISAEQLDYLLSHLQKNLDLSKLEEFTIEANPGDLTVDKIEVLKKSAVNRVSLGVQTFDDKHLRQIGRSHNQAQIYESINSLKSAGFHNISIDLIYALPGQTMDQVKENVRKALELDIPHLSLYSLILEHHTVFMNKMRRGKLNLPTGKQRCLTILSKSWKKMVLSTTRFLTLPNPGWRADIISCIGIMMNTMELVLGPLVM